MIPINRDFDDFIGGGLLDGVLTHVYGPPGSGKSNLALIAVVNASNNGRVIYMDTEGGFSVERLKQITSGRLEKVVENVMLLKPTTFSEQLATVKKLDSLVKENTTSLVVVDSIASLYRLEEERDIRAFGRQLAQLLRIARKYELPVLMTNQVYTDVDSGSIVPVGGKMNEYWSKIVLELGREDSRRFALIKKHLFKPEGLKLEFKIVNSGLEVIRETPTKFNVRYTPK
ncbi:MAG: DNA repair and recombination protein RadB [Candidatus Altiarchaeota archaeon]